MTRVWRLRLVVFTAHLLVIGLIIWFVSTVSQPPVIDKSQADKPLAERFVNPDYIAGGAQIYKQYCVACHGAVGQGGIGPALNDDEWLHGASSEAVIRSVGHGYPERGMAAWQPVIGDAGVEQVSAFVLKIGEYFQKN